MATLVCNAKLEGTFKVRAKIGGHEYIMDEPIEQGGTNEGAVPGGLLIASLAGCKLMVTAIYAKEKGFQLNECEAVVTGDFNEREDGMDVDLNIDILVDTDASDDEIKKLDDHLNKKCPIGQILSQGDKPVGGQVKRK